MAFVRCEEANACVVLSLGRHARFNDYKGWADGAAGVALCCVGLCCIGSIGIRVCRAVYGFVEMKWKIE